MDLTFSISYAEDVERVEKLFASTLEAHPKVLEELAATSSVSRHAAGDARAAGCDSERVYDGGP